MAANKIWADAGTAWNTPANWSGGVPLSTDTASFGSFGGTGAISPDVDAPASVLGITFANAANGSYTISSLSSSALTLGVNGINNADDNTHFISAPLVLGGSTSFTVSSTGGLTISGTVNIGSNTLTLAGSAAGLGTVSGVVSGSGTIQKSNTGTWTLSGAGSSVGVINISNGTLNVNASMTTGTMTGSAGTISFGSGASLTITGTSSYGSTLTGAGGLTKSTGGTLTLSGGSSSYTGATTISAGTILFNAAATFPSSSPFSMGGGTLQLNAVTTYGSTTGGTLTLTANSSVDFGSGIGASILNFGNSSATTWTPSTTLTILNYNSAAGDRLRVGTNSSGLTSTQLSQITFSGFSSGATIDSSGFISPVPEPATYATILGVAVLGSAAYRRSRRRKQAS